MSDHRKYLPAGGEAGAVGNTATHGQATYAQLEAWLSASQASEAELRAKLEAAEARIKASQEQEPEFVDFEVYGYASDNVRNESWCKEKDWSKSEFFSIIGMDWEQNDTIRNVTFHHYAAPLIPPELAELQRENAELKRHVEALQKFDCACHHDTPDDICEYHRKLLESKVPENEWIHVEDALPSDTNLKLIRYAHNGRHLGIALSHYLHPQNMPDGHLMWDFEFGNTQGTKVTHWFTIPAQPKEPKQ